MLTSHLRTLQTHKIYNAVELYMFRIKMDIKNPNFPSSKMVHQIKNGSNHFLQCYTVLFPILKFSHLPELYLFLFRKNRRIQIFCCTSLTKGKDQKGCLSKVENSDFYIYLNSKSVKKMGHPVFFRN